MTARRKNKKCFEKPKAELLQFRCLIEVGEDWQPGTDEDGKIESWPATFGSISVTMLEDFNLRPLDLICSKEDLLRLEKALHKKGCSLRGALCRIAVLSSASLPNCTFISWKWRETSSLSISSWNSKTMT